MEVGYSNYKEKISNSANGQSGREILGQAGAAVELSSG
jgi:hypothetical protein